MIKLKPIDCNNVCDLDGTAYETMSLEQRRKLIQESKDRKHNGSYFEFLVVYHNDTVVGFMNLYAHNEHTISCAPEIRTQHRQKGFAIQVETMALEYAKKQGYTFAVADVEDSNLASIALHEKLGFKLEKTYVNKKGKLMRLYKTML